MISHFKMVQEFSPFPKYSNRKAWENLSPEVKKDYQMAVESLQPITWESFQATRYMDFIKNGNRSVFEASYFKRRKDLFALVMAECIEGNGRLLADIMDGVWLICEESTWVLPAHNNRKGSTNELPNLEESIYIDLFSAETGSMISWIYYLLGDTIASISPLIKRRMEIEVQKRILEPYMQNDSFFWMGFTSDKPVNNWNPWINSNVLVAFLIFASGEQREKGVAKVIDSANRFLSFYAEDGGCDEGPNYFTVAGASLLDLLEELAEVAPEANSMFENPLIRNMASFIYKVYLGEDYYVNFADGPAHVNAPAGLLNRIGIKSGDENLVGFSTHILRNNLTVKQHMLQDRHFFRYLSNLFSVYEEKPFQPPKQTYFEGIQVMVARDCAGSLDGFVLAAKGGNNAESHNHNDIGSFVVYANQKPVFIDAGVETYTRKTFSAERYSLWTMQSCYHNTPTINGYDQFPGKNARATNVQQNFTDKISHLSMELKDAYPIEAGIISYNREFLFTHGKSIQIKDSLVLSHEEQPLVFHFMCFDKPVFEKDGVILGGVVSLVPDPGVFTMSVEEVLLTDEKISADWQRDRLYRLQLTAKERINKRSFCFTIIKKGNWYTA